MISVDSSGWVDYLTDGELADAYAGYLEDLDEIVTSPIVLYEVYKWIKRERDEETALRVAAQIQKTRVVPLTQSIALTAADLSLEHSLAMADAIVYATAQVHEVDLVTSDRDFAHLTGVVYLEK